MIQWTGLSELSLEEYFLEIWWIAIGHGSTKGNYWPKYRRLSTETSRRTINISSDHSRPSYETSKKKICEWVTKNLEVTNFAAGDYILLTYPNRPPYKLAGMYRGPMVITSIDRPDLIKVRDLVSNKESMRIGFAL